MRSTTKYLLIFALMGASFAIQACKPTNIIQWSGYTWNVKNGTGMGPGPNNWSSSTGSVWVDDTGSLNLQVRDILGSGWNSTEVWLPTSLGYGTYEFLLKSRVDTIDKNLVSAMYLYQDDTHEFDIEWSKWGDGSSPFNSQFVVQPGFTPGNRYQFNQAFQPGQLHKHRIIWTPTGITFNVEVNGVIVQQWVYTGANNFAPGHETVHINNWQNHGKAPSNNQPETMTLVSFTFTPRVLGAPGENIASLGTDGKSRSFDGTSAAAPFVTGAMALLRRKAVVPPLLNAWTAYQIMSAHHGRR